MWMQTSTFAEKGDHHESLMKLSSGQETSRGCFKSRLKEERTYLQNIQTLPWGLEERGLFLLLGASQHRLPLFVPPIFWIPFTGGCACLDSIRRVPIEWRQGRVKDGLIAGKSTSSQGLWMPTTRPVSLESCQVKVMTNQPPPSYSRPLRSRTRPP